MGPYVIQIRCPYYPQVRKIWAQNFEKVRQIWAPVSNRLVQWWAPPWAPPAHKTRMTYQMDNLFSRRGKNLMRWFRWACCSSMEHLDGHVRQ